jgi:UDP-N-acetylglucosamine--N-acetylmuramyl-(pentapeptide) pyrophosphoryl-undecaprenol N-acetylglucosamine transferase
MIMKGLIFAEGNGYGHASRDMILSEHFGFDIMTYGMGTKYLKMRGKKHIEIPSPYIIKSENGTTKITADVRKLLKLIHPNVSNMIVKEFRKVDFIIVDGSPLGLLLARLAGKKTILIANDTSSLVGFSGIEKGIAGRLNEIILTYPEWIFIPDYKPPLTITKYNLENVYENLEIIGPLLEPAKQIKHHKKIIVSTTDEKINKELKKELGNEALYGFEIGNIKPYYQSSDFVISHGGHTSITEALAYGKPSVVITDFSYPERRNHVKVLEELNVGFGIEKKLFRTEYIWTIIDAVKHLDKGRLNQYKKEARNNRPLSAIEKKINEIMK